MSDIPTKPSTSLDSTSQDENISESSKSLTNEECNKVIPATEAVAPSPADEKKKELCSRMRRYLLTERQLKRNGYPRPTSRPGQCILPQSKGFNASSRKKCWRCKKNFVLHNNGEFEKKNDVCRHSQGTCQNHVHRDNLDDPSGYLEFNLSSEKQEMNGIYALDCEMCYTVRGLELIRVSVVDFDCKLVYDTLVKPFGKIVDYNTKWSGVEEKDMINITTNLTDVQNEFSKRFSADTIFVGHSLECDLKALRIIHSSIIDSAVLFPHRRGFPYKRALRNLVKDHLGLIIQQNVGNTGHDSTEDANACVKLLKWKLRRDTGYIV